MVGLLDKPPKCYHKKLHRVFNVISIDWHDDKVMVEKMVINGEDSQVYVPNLFSFQEVKLLHYVNKLDNSLCDLIDGDLVLFGEGLKAKGYIRFNQAKDTWEIVQEDYNDAYSTSQTTFKLSDIDSAYLHKIGNKYGAK